MSFKVPEEYRYSVRFAPSRPGDMFGLFRVPFESFELFVIATDGKADGEGWQHVSVSMSSRTPNWKQMCFIKDLFWDPEDCVVQFHPPKSDYVDNHEHCLHLWRHEEKEFPRPPKKLV